MIAYDRNSETNTLFEIPYDIFSAFEHEIALNSRVNQSDKMVLLSDIKSDLIKKQSQFI